MAKDAAGEPAAADAALVPSDARAVNRRSTRADYVGRRKIFPLAVKGPFRRLKWGVMAATLAVYYGTPWLRWERGAGLPDQAVLIDFPSRRFYFFSSRFGRRNFTSLPACWFSPPWRCF